MLLIEPVGVERHLVLCNNETKKHKNVSVDHQWGVIGFALLTTYQLALASRQRHKHRSLLAVGPMHSAVEHERQLAVDNMQHNLAEP